MYYLELRGKIEGDGMELRNVFYTKFLRQLQYDQDYAAKRLQLWGGLIESLYNSYSKEFIINRDAPDYIFEFFEFIDGNGFTIEYQGKGEKHIQIAVTETEW